MAASIPHRQHGILPRCVRLLLLWWCGLWWPGQATPSLDQVLPGHRRGRIVSFLASSLTATTQQRYREALEDFNNDLSLRGLSVWTLSEESLDWLLADRVLDIYEEFHSEVGLSSAAILVAACPKAHPRHRYQTAFKALDVWRRRHPPAQALA